MFKASSFKLSMFRQCPRHYKFHYIDDLKTVYAKPRPYFTMGDHIHAALKDFLSIVPVEERNVSRLEGLLREKWRRNRSGFKNLDDEKMWGEKALNQMRWFAQNQDLTVTPLMVEEFHETVLSPKITLIGKIDRVDQEADGSLHIIDYKTGKIPEELDRTQLYIYALILAREQKLPVTKVTYLYLDAGEFQTIQPTITDLEQAADYVVEAVERILAEKKYPATINSYCGTCDFLEICPKKDEILGLALGEEEPDY
ncbi:MAG TPA: PD-(D/E)XK nuclease family protein [Dehalococcoidia bacterium]|nr:PD-(D/E)XK nuclease family protein [Dehalococcoidia bacterium]